MLFTIGQVTKMYDISHDTLRYYDKIDLLKPSVKKENGYRYYTIREIELLEIILIAKQLEIPIKDIKEIIEQEDVNAYTELFKRHERVIEKKISYLNKLKLQVKASKEKCINMSKFENEEIKNNLKHEFIDKKVIFLHQSGGSCIGDLTRNKNIIILATQNENNNIEMDENIIGVEVLESEKFDYKKYKDYTEKHFKGNYIKVTRKDTAENIDKYINYAIDKYINKETSKQNIEVLIECIFTVIRKNGDSMYFTNIYIPKV